MRTLLINVDILPPGVIHAFELEAAAYAIIDNDEVVKDRLGGITADELGFYVPSESLRKKRDELDNKVREMLSLL